VSWHDVMPSVIDLDPGQYHSGGGDSRSRPSKYEIK